ncbi:MAG: hypothetical protein B7Y37_13820 [Sphingobacteriia bacterium 28-36-52]|nr:MAG: hypothetical protein B7Y37_13820 [Sphingobacteriia bacterium 28-36-52]
MALSQILDLTTDYNNGKLATIEIGGYDYAIVQLVNPSAAVTFKTSNDANAIEGASDGNASTAINFTDVQGINLASGSGATSLAATGLIRFNYIGRFLRLDGAGTAVCDKVIVRLFKIN